MGGRVQDDQARQFPPGALGGEQIRAAIEGIRALVQGYRSLDEQVQPNGFDLTLGAVDRFVSSGAIGATNADRALPDLERLAFDDDGWLHLAPGPYLLTFNEVVDLPLGLMALGRPRSSLTRCGVAIHSAVWDAGYRGRSTSMLTVDNGQGFRLARDARLLQLVFFSLSRPPETGYQGAYQGENLGDRGR